MKVLPWPKHWYNPKKATKNKSRQIQEQIEHASIANTEARVSKLTKKILASYKRIGTIDLKEEIVSNVIRILIGQLWVDDTAKENLALTNLDSKISSLGPSSPDILELVMALEQENSISIPDEDIYDTRSDFKIKTV